MNVLNVCSNKRAIWIYLLINQIGWIKMVSWGGSLNLFFCFYSEQKGVQKTHLIQWSLTSKLLLNNYSHTTSGAFPPTVIYLSSRLVTKCWIVLKKGKTNPLNTKINKPAFRSATWLTQIFATGSFGASPCDFNGQRQPLLFNSCCRLWHINMRPCNYSSQGEKKYSIICSDSITWHTWRTRLILPAELAW